MIIIHQIFVKNTAIAVVVQMKIYVCKHTTIIRTDLMCFNYMQTVKVI